jgi:hypothetical protein
MQNIAQKADWNLMYEVGSGIHQRLHELWQSAAAVYIKDENNVRITFTINEDGKRLHFPVDIPIAELRQQGDGEVLAALIVETFRRSLTE